MNRSKKPQSVMSDQENNEGIAEMELQKLQRQYRIMEGDRKAYSEESRAILKKQKVSIDQLKQDNKTLMNDIKLTEARMRGSEDVNGNETIVVLNETQDSYMKKLKLIQQQINEMGKNILETEKRIAEQREKMGGNNATQNNMAIQKQIRVMENRLDKALVKFNKSLATNKQLRQVIDNLRRERAVFENVYRKLEKELSEQKKTMADIIEASNNAYESRDEAQVKMMALKEKAEKEFQAFTQEIKELDRILEQDRKFKSFMSVKNAQRSGLNASSSQKNKNENENDAFYKSSQENLSEHNVEDYDKVFKMIKEVTGVEGINELVQKFTDVEDQNFSLFNYVNEVNDQVEKLNEEIGGIRGDIEKYQASAATEENERKVVVQRLEQELSDARKEVSLCDDNFQKITQTFESLQSGLTKMIERLEAMSVTSGTTSTKYVKQQESDAADDKTYLLKDLGWIENRANELIMANFLHSLPRRSAEEKESVTTIALTFGGITMQGAVQPLMNYSIQAPATGDDFDSDDEGNEDFDRPMTFEELRLKSLKGIAKREKNSGGSNPRSKNKKKLISAE